MRQSYFVSYDLRGREESSERYPELIDAIKGYGYWGKLMLSTWIVVTEQSAEEIRNHLEPFLQKDDRIFVGPVGKPAAWRNLIADNDWMKARP
jgi:RNase P/RNase MRP subunit p30